MQGQNPSAKMKSVWGEMRAPRELNKFICQLSRLRLFEDNYVNVILVLCLYYVVKDPWRHPEDEGWAGRNCSFLNSQFHWLLILSMVSLHLPKANCFLPWLVCDLCHSWEVWWTELVAWREIQEMMETHSQSILPSSGTQQLNNA